MENAVGGGSRTSYSGDFCAGLHRADFGFTRVKDGNSEYTSGFKVAGMQPKKSLREECEEENRET